MIKNYCITCKFCLFFYRFNLTLVWHALDFHYRFQKTITSSFDELKQSVIKYWCYILTKISLIILFSKWKQYKRRHSCSTFIPRLGHKKGHTFQLLQAFYNLTCEGHTCTPWLYIMDENSSSGSFPSCISMFGGILL